MKYNKDNLLSSMKNDKNAFSRLYTEIYQDLFRLAVYMSGDFASAEDIVSETIIDIYKGISKLKNPDTFEYWALKILSAKVKRYFKKKYNSFNSGNPNFSQLNSSTGQFDNTQNIIERFDLLNHLQSFSKTERIIISLCVIDGYTSTEVGNILNMKPSTVRSKLNRSLKKLRLSLDGKET